MRGANHTIGPITLTHAQQQACAWLAEHGGTGVWTQDGTLLAAGETAPVVRQTWNCLRGSGCLVFEGARVTISPMGRRFAMLIPWDGQPTPRDVELEEIIDDAVAAIS